MYNISTASSSGLSSSGGSNVEGSSNAQAEMDHYQDGGLATLLAPMGGRLVVFESGIEHEVLPAFAHR